MAREEEAPKAPVTFLFKLKRLAVWCAATIVLSGVTYSSCNSAVVLEKQVNDPHEFRFLLRHIAEPETREDAKKEFARNAEKNGFDDLLVQYRRVYESSDVSELDRQRARDEMYRQLHNIHGIYTMKFIGLALLMCAGGIGTLIAGVSAVSSFYAMFGIKSDDSTSELTGAR